MGKMMKILRPENVDGHVAEPAYFQCDTEVYSLVQILTGLEAQDLGSQGHAWSCTNFTRIELAAAAVTAGFQVSLVDALGRDLNLKVWPVEGLMVQVDGEWKNIAQFTKEAGDE